MLQHHKVAIDASNKGSAKKQSYIEIKSRKGYTCSKTSEFLLPFDPFSFLDLCLVLFSSKPSMAGYKHQSVNI